MSDKIMLSLCDLTGAMALPWAEAGYRCYTVDTQHPEGESEHPLHPNITRVGADILEWMPPSGEVIFVASFPPCTDLAGSGARWWEAKGPEAYDFAMSLVERCAKIGAWSGAPWFIENPVGRIPARWRKADHWFHPYEFGAYPGGENDDYVKKTGLWVGNGFKMPERRPIEPNPDPKIRERIWRAAPSPERANLRSKTPMGFAHAVWLANDPALNTTKEAGE